MTRTRSCAADEAPDPRGHRRRGRRPGPAPGRAGGSLRPAVDADAARAARGPSGAPGLGAPVGRRRALRPPPVPRGSARASSSGSSARRALPAHAGLGARGVRLWRWRTALADRLGDGPAVSGVALIRDSSCRGVLAGFTLLPHHPGGRRAARGGHWLARSGWQLDRGRRGDRGPHARSRPLGEPRARIARFHSERPRSPRDADPRAIGGRGRPSLGGGGTGAIRPATRSRTRRGCRQSRASAATAARWSGWSGRWPSSAEDILPVRRCWWSGWPTRRPTGCPQSCRGFRRQRHGGTRSRCG